MHKLAKSDREFSNPSFAQEIAPMVADLFLDASHLCNLLEMAQSDIMSDVLSRRGGGEEEEMLQAVLRAAHLLASQISSVADKLNDNVDRQAAA
jgi:hypothetical protein